MLADAPFVDRPVGDEEPARALAHRVATDLGVGTPRLVRLAMNATYETDDVVIRVGRPTADPASAYDLTDRLRGLGVRVPEPAPGRPFATAGPLAATVWRRVPASGAVDWSEVGAMIARLHGAAIDVAASYPVAEGARFPWWQFDDLLARADPMLDDAAASSLRDTVDRYRGWAADSQRAEPWVLCHGDVHPENVLAGPDGPVILDWDLLCVAPRAWDHAPLLATEHRWGGAPEWYHEFARGYGADWHADPVTVALARLREVAATLMRVLAEGPDRSATGEAAQRLRWWRHDPDAPVWRYT